MTSAAIALPFSFDPNGRILSTTDPRKIMQDRVVLVVMTAVGERVMRPSYGTQVRKATFETLNVAQAIIEEEVNAAFSNYLPYLSLEGVDTTMDADGNMNVSVTYKYGATSNPETVVVKTAILSQSGSVIAEVSSGI